MSLTALFVKRPTLVTVLIALVLLAGTLSGITIVKQQFPNYDVPTVQVAITYPGAPTTELRDAIVRPLEDQIAGAPDLQTIETAIEPGQATLTVRFTLGSDVNSDLVQTQGRVAERRAPITDGPADADGLDLRSRASRGRLARREFVVARAGRALVARHQ